MRPMINRDARDMSVNSTKSPSYLSVSPCAVGGTALIAMRKEAQYEKNPGQPVKGAVGLVII